MSFIKSFITTKASKAKSFVRRKAADFRQSVRDILNNPAERLSRVARRINPFSNLRNSSSASG